MIDLEANARLRALVTESGGPTNGHVADDARLVIIRLRAALDVIRETLRTDPLIYADGDTDIAAGVRRLMAAYVDRRAEIDRLFANTREGTRADARAYNAGSATERERIATLLRARAGFSSGALAEALEDVARGVLEGETDPDRVLRDPPPEEVQRRAVERRVHIAGIKATVRQWCRDNLDDPEVLAEVHDVWGNPITDPERRRDVVSARHAYNVFRRRFPAVHEVLGDVAADEWTIDDVSVEDIEAAIRAQGPAPTFTASIRAVGHCEAPTCDDGPACACPCEDCREAVTVPLRPAVEARPSANVAAFKRTRDRDALGRLVREVWVTWAREQPDVADHPAWVVSYDDIPERDREVDRRIGGVVASYVIGALDWMPPHSTPQTPPT